MRFFTVLWTFWEAGYGLYKFTKNIIDKKPIEVYNYGNHQRDFTYIDDITNAIQKLITKPSSKIPYNLFNIGSGNPIALKKFIKIIEKKLNIKSKVKYLPLQKGDVKKTYANIKKLKKNFTKFKPQF